MQVIRKVDLIAQVAENWRLAHQRRNEWIVPEQGAHPKAMYERLLTLSRRATEEDVVAILGDDRWTVNICQQCGKDRDVLVAFGAGEVHHPTDTAFVCVACLEAAVELTRI
jgi:hypothetical protein